MSSESEPPIMVQMRQAQEAQEVRLRITLEFGLFMMLLGIIVLIRVTNLRYNTLFIDEAINAVIGEDLLVGVLQRQATTFHFGSYLYPLVAGVAERMGGVAGLRLTAALSNTIAVILVYLTTRTLFNKYAALFAMFFFGFVSSNVNMGQLAVYDSLALPLLALSLYCLVRAALLPQQERSWLTAASVALVFTVLSKYIGLIYVPALGLTAFALYLSRGRGLWESVRLLALYFIFPAFILLSIYGLYYYADLRLVAMEQGYAWAERREVAFVILEEMWFVAIPAFVGLVLLLTNVWRGVVETPATLHPLARRCWPSKSRSVQLFAALFVVVLALTWMAAPAYHWWGHNIRSLWKNVNYSFIFLAPLAGYAVATLIESNRRRHESARLMGLAIALVIMYVFVDRTLDRNWAFQESWPNATGVIHYLNERGGLDTSSRVLAEGMDIYEYYMGLGTADGEVWTSVWYMKYGDLYGLEAMTRALEHQYFDYVILEGYYEVSMRDALLPILVETGYVVGYEEMQPLRSGGPVHIQVFVVEERIQ